MTYIELRKQLGIVPATLLEKLNFWLRGGYGEVYNNKRYIYNTLEQWVDQIGISKYQVYRGFKKLREMGIVEAFKPRATQWYHRMSYTINYEILKKMCGEVFEQPVSMGGTVNDTNRNIDVARTQNHMQVNLPINGKNTKEQQRNTIAVANVSTTIETTKEEESPKRSECLKSEKNINTQEVNNPQWENHIRQIKATGVVVNRTVLAKVKEAITANVTKAIAMLTERNLRGVKNRSGYFIALLKIAANTDAEVVIPETNNLGSTFLVWFDLMCKFGYTSKYELREDGYWISDYWAKSWRSIRDYQDESGGWRKGYSIKELMDKL